MDERPYIVRSDGSKLRGVRVAAGSLTELRLPLTDLSYIRIDHQTRRQFESTEVVIESPFVLEVAGVEHPLDPGERAGLGPLLSVYPDTLTRASVEPDATLRLVFASGATISVPPDPYYEPWQVNGPGDYLVVCEPGTAGGLSVWS